MVSMDHVLDLRMKVQPCGTRTLSAQMTFLQLQDDVLTMRSERSALQPGVDDFRTSKPRTTR